MSSKDPSQVVDQIRRLREERFERNQQRMKEEELSAVEVPKPVTQKSAGKAALKKPKIDRN
jgi:hypothetical protein